MVQVCDESEKDYWFRKDASSLLKRLNKCIQRKTIIMNRCILVRNMLLPLFILVVTMAGEDPLYVSMKTIFVFVLCYGIVFCMGRYIVSMVDDLFIIIILSIKFVEKPTINDVSLIASAIIIQFGNELAQMPPNYRKVWFIIYSESLYDTYVVNKLLGH